MHFPKLSLHQHLGFKLAVPLAAALAVSSCGFKHKKYENPITAQTQQPDKVLFDKAIKDIEKGRYEIARITLNTLINTYESSEFLAKAQFGDCRRVVSRRRCARPGSGGSRVQEFHPVLSHHAGSCRIAGKTLHDSLQADG